MKFRKMVTITLYTRQQKRHWCIEQSYGLWGRGRGWEDLGEWHWNMYKIMYETSRQSRFDAWYWMLGAGALGRPRGMVWGRRREEGSGWGTHVYLWWIHFDIWQNQYNILKFKKKKDSDAGRDWGQEEKGTTEDEMAGWHHWLDGHESEWTPGVGHGQGGLACCDSWGRKESDTTERLNWTELNWSLIFLFYRMCSKNQNH